ncbi:MAG: lamin tail domain-containing protein, partial [Acidobacteriota bacterium]
DRVGPGTVIIPDGCDSRRGCDGGGDPGGGDPGGGDPGGGDPGGGDPGGGDDGGDQGDPGPGGDEPGDGGTSLTCTGPLVVNEVMSDNDAGIPAVDNIDGSPSDWFEIQNISNATVEVADFSFSDGGTPWSPGAVSQPLAPGQRMVIYASDRNEVVAGEWHTDFKLSNGEVISIFDADTNPIDSLTIPDDLRVNDSYGLLADGDCDNPRYFDDADQAINAVYGPTPGAANANSVLPYNYAGYTPDPVITPASGMAASGEGEITAVSGATIHYELDGSTPIIGSSPSILELLPFNIVGCTMARAQALLPDHIRSYVVSATYVNNGRDHTIPVFLISGEPTDLDVGPTSLYQATPDEDDERPVQVDVLSGGGVIFSQNAGLQINAPGGASSLLPQLPLRLNARAEYGPNRFEHQFFSSKDASTFKSLVLKNGGANFGGNDWSRTMFREPLAHQLMHGDPTNIAIDYQGYEPVIVYLNCGYYGIHNLREKINHHYPESNHGVDDDDVNFYKPNPVALRRGNDTFPAIQTAIETTPPEQLWDFLHTPASGIDYNEFISYQVAERFFGNDDWPNNNQAKWQEDPDGLYRWILYDLDGGFQPNMNIHLTFATGLISAFIVSDEVFADFVQHLAARMSVTYRPDRALPVIDDMAAAIEAEISNPADESDPLYHVGRWAPSGGIQSLAAWQAQVQVLRDYFLGRSQTVYNLLEGGSGAFGVSGGYDVTFDREGQGSIRAQRVPIPGLPFDGRFFTDEPLTLEAIADAGFVFEGWYTGSVAAGNLLSNDSVYAYPSPAGNVTLIANFEPDSIGSTAVIFSEIHYNSSASFDTGDWVELFNDSASDVDLSGWEFRDDDDTHIFTFPSETILEGFGFLILCRNQEDWEAAIANTNWWVTTCTDWGSFGLNDSDAVRLFDSSGALVQSVDYDSMAPWPTQQDEGDSLQFLPLSGGWPTNAPNGDPANWFYPAFNTPGWVFH